MLLAIDIGNSTVGLAAFSGDTFVSGRFAASSSLPSTDILKEMEGLLSREGMDKAPEGIVISSVVPELTGKFIDAGRTFCADEPVIIGPRCTGGLLLDVEFPDTVGPDRIASAVGAALLAPPPVAVVDFGTATTVNFIVNGGPVGTFRGGAILPGISMMFRALSEGTAQLPLVDPSGKTRPLGRTTEENIRAGVLLGTAGAVERIVRDASLSEGGEFKIVLTGGMMEYIKGSLKQVKNTEPDLVLKGMKAIYENERKNA